MAAPGPALLAANTLQGALGLRQGRQALSARGWTAAVSGLVGHTDPVMSAPLAEAVAASQWLTQFRPAGVGSSGCGPCSAGRWVGEWLSREPSAPAGAFLVAGLFLGPHGGRSVWTRPVSPSRASRPLCPVPPQYVGAPVAYIQQIFVKSSVSPWHRDLLAVDVFRSPLSRAFQLVEEIRNHVLRDRYPWGPRLPAPVCPGGRCRPPAAR